MEQAFAKEEGCGAKVRAVDVRLGYGEERRGRSDGRGADDNTHGKGVGSKVHGPVATCESRQSISRMRMCMQMGDSEDGVGTRGRRTWHGMAWHDTPWLGLTGAATCMHACVYVYASISGSQPAPKCDHRKVASDTMCWVACLQTDDAAGARRK